jgi:hypothetical protein
MAQVNLWLREAYEGNVPPVCVRCGAPASAWKNHTAFVGLGGLPFFIVKQFFVDIVEHSGRIWLRLPFCHMHRHYWLWRRAITLGSFAVVIFYPILAFVLITETSDGSSARVGTRPNQVAGLACMLSVAVPPLWLVAYVIWCRIGIRVAAYNIESVTLGGVCQEFVDAVPEYRSSTAGHLPDMGRFGLPPATNRDERIQNS